MKALCCGNLFGCTVPEGITTLADSLVMTHLGFCRDKACLVPREVGHTQLFSPERVFELRGSKASGLRLRGLRSGKKIVFYPFTPLITIVIDQIPIK